MALPEKSLAILDVGHGNCAVLVEAQNALIIDAGPGSALLEFLEYEGITSIDLILISHADKDHIGGLIALIASNKINISRIRLNTDSLKESQIWDDLLYELDKAREQNEIDFEPSLTKCPAGKYDQGETQVEVVAPSAYLAGRGPGSKDRENRKLTTNSVSAVVRLLYNGKPFALFTGDLDEIGLDDLIAHETDANSPLLVFPHHGGKSGATNLAEFAERICSIVNPQTIIFSIGRGRHNTPQPELVKSIRERLPDVRILCTQLSEHCAVKVSGTRPAHLLDIFSRGGENNQCCAGTMVIDLNNPENIQPDGDAHKAFISEYASTALCLSD